MGIASAQAIWQSVPFVPDRVTGRPGSSVDPGPTTRRFQKTVATEFSRERFNALTPLSERENPSLEFHSAYRARVSALSLLAKEDVVIGTQIMLLGFAGNSFRNSN